MPNAVCVVTITGDLRLETSYSYRSASTGDRREARTAG